MQDNFDVDHDRKHESAASVMTDNLMATLSERISLSLTLRNQSLRGFCAENGLSTSGMSRIMNQSENITVKTLCTIAAAFGMDGPFKLINPSIALEELRPTSAVKSTNDCRICGGSGWTDGSAEIRGERDPAQAHNTTCVGCDGTGTEAGSSSE